MKTRLFALCMAVAGCGGAVASGVGVGRVGQNLSEHAQSVPQGAEVCALKEALADKGQAGEKDKTVSETCAKALETDRLYKRSMVVLSAYGDTLEAIAAETSPETAGRLEAAATGVSGAGWANVEDAKDKAALEGATALVEKMGAATKKDDLAAFVKDAAPHVKAICDGLGPYLDAQAKGAAEALKETEKRRASRIEKRCLSLEGKSVCVSETSVDRVVYADTFGSLTSLVHGHEEARDSVNAFCAAHAKLEEAAGSGTLSKDETYAAIVEAVKSSRGGGAASAAEPAPAAPPAGSAPPPKK